MACIRVRFRRFLQPVWQKFKIDWEERFAHGFPWVGGRVLLTVAIVAEGLERERMEAHLVSGK